MDDGPLAESGLLLQYVPTYIPAAKAKRGAVENQGLLCLRRDVCSGSRAIFSAAAMVVLIPTVSVSNNV